MAKKAPEIQEYQYGFHDKDVSIFRTKKGLTREIVEEISRIKEEPEWMLEFRLKSLEIFEKLPMPKWGGDLDDLNFDEITYYVKPSEKRAAVGMKYRKKSKLPSTSWVFRKPSRSSWPAYPPSTNPKLCTTTCRKTWKNWVFSSATWILP